MTMNKSILLLGFLLCWGTAQAAPIEDEPLPFDTKMPARIVQQQAGEAEPEAASAPAANPRALTNCKTVVKKVHGRKVRKEVCSKTSATKKTVQTKKSLKGKKQISSSAKRTASKSKSTKKNKRR